MTRGAETYVRAWLEKAEHDVVSAQRLLEIEPMILDNACFHCQQAIEKFLKALLAYHGVEIEKTHNIIFLLSQCSDFDAIFSTIDPLNINAYAVQGRYPDENIAPSLEEVKIFYQLALYIKTLVTDRIIFS